MPPNARPNWFLVVEDPAKSSTWHLQVKDENGPNHRLMGAAHAALLSPNGYRGNKYQGPNRDEAITKLKALYKAEKMEWPSANMSTDAGAEDIERGKAAIADAFEVLLSGATSGQAVTFSADVNGATTDGDMVVKTGKLFEVGRYPDKGLNFDQSDIDAAVQNFRPVPVRLGHDRLLPASHRMPEAIRGKMGQLSRVFADGTSLMGEVHIPKWLDAMLDGESRKVSTEWDPFTKSLVGLALVQEPRVSDAALFAAFSADPDNALLAAFTVFASRHDTPSGQIAMQMIHDVAARAGAVCRRPVAMASRHESSAIQQAHDLAMSHGAQCETASAGGSMPVTYATDKPKGMSMNIREWLTGKAKEDGVELDPAEIAAAFSTGPDPAVAELKAKLEAEQAKNDALRQQQEQHAATFARLETDKRHAEAVTFAQAQVQAKRVTPAAAELLVPLAERIAAADSTVTFAEGEVPTSKLLADFIAAQPDFSKFTTEHIKDEKVAALFAQTVTDDGTEKPPTDERIKELMKLYPEGRNGAATKA